MRATLAICAALVIAAGGAAHARDTAPRSTSAQMNRLIGSVCNMEYGNGGYAFRSYNPAKFSRRGARKLIRSDMKNFEARGVSFKTVTGAPRVKAQLRRTLGSMAPSNVATLTRAIDGFKKLGVLQDVVYRGLVGGKAVGDTYFSIPHQVFFCLKTPTQRGKRLEAFMEFGD
jgi:hypothetical protein